MAFPRKVGLRRISVNGVTYHWRASFGELRGSLSIYGPESSGRELVIRSPHWFDLWMGYPYPFVLKKAPMAVSPALVRAAIEHGLTEGWDPHSRGQRLIFEFREGKFEPNGTIKDSDPHPHF